MLEDFFSPSYGCRQVCMRANLTRLNPNFGSKIGFNPKKNGSGLVALVYSMFQTEQTVPRLASLSSKISRHSFYGYYSSAVLRCPSWKFHNLIYIIAYFSLFNVPPSRQTLPRLGQGRGPCVNSRQIVQVHKTNLYCTRNPICNPCLPQKVTMVTLSGLPEAMQIWQGQTVTVAIR